MPVNKIAIDGLWRCLCPSFNATVLSQLRISVRRGMIRPSIGDRKSASPRSSRSLSSESTINVRRIHCRHQIGTAEARLKNIKHAINVGGSVETSALPYASLNEIPISQLHDALRDVRTENGAYGIITGLVAYLIKERGEKPSLLHYDALIRANADPSRGSANVVVDLLHELKEDGIIPDSGLYHSALQALANHPDYLFRTEILQQMNDRWFTLTSDGWHNLVVGLLRERQYEIAMEKLEEMQRGGIRIHSWLYDIFIYLFCESQELDEALRILRYRVDNGDNKISANAWYHVLDACSSNYHYEGTLYVWRKRVETSYINPSDGICTNVINTAARHHDPNLITDVLRVLSGRTSKLDVHHYEALITAYVGLSDVKTSLQVLGIMKNSGLEPNESSTRPIYAHLCTSADLPSTAFKFLQSIHSDGKAIPTAAVNAILEAYVSQGHLQEAVKQYKSLHTICSSGPNTSTFNALLQGCAKTPGNKHLAMFIASEMAALSIRPDVLTYDRLVLVCLAEDDYEDAFRYLEEMKKTFEGNELRTGTCIALFKRCVAARDDRAWSLLEGLEKRGHGAGKLRSWAEEEWNIPLRRIDTTQEAEPVVNKYQVGM